MTVKSYASDINQLMSQYENPAYGKYLCARSTKTSLTVNGFMGSRVRVSLKAGDSLALEALGCLAAPRVSLVAKKTISLGEGRKDGHPTPVRIYAPLKLSIRAQRISLGDIKLEVEPEEGFISCNRLTMAKPQNAEDPLYFEIVESWVDQDATVVETVQYDPDAEASLIESEAEIAPSGSEITTSGALRSEGTDPL